MKIQFLIISILALSFNSLFAQDVDKNIKVSDFDIVNLKVFGEVHLTQGDDHEVRVVTSDYIYDRIEVYVDNDELIIKQKKKSKIKYSKDNKLDIYVTLPEISKIKLLGSGDINTTHAFENVRDLDIILNGSGDINFEGEVDDINLNLTGSGDINVKGTADDMKVQLAGSGDIKADKMVAEDCDVKLLGSGDVYVHAREELEAYVMGSGDIRYEGDARVESSILGSGDITRN